MDESPLRSGASARLDEVLARIDVDLDQSRKALFDWLRIPSISAQPVYAGDCRRAAIWARDRLAALGFAAELRETPGHPVVLARKIGAGPHILFYGHYDVQPPDPAELWTSQPFEPALLDGPHGKRFVARGAVDDKGQVAMFLEALRAWKETTGAIPGNFTVLIEGEEEVGSVHLDAFLHDNREALRADVAVISDTGMWNVDTPAVTTRLRGLVYTQVTVRGPDKDLHSGLYGGSAINPINVLTRILGCLHDADGRVQVPGFYDAVKPVSPEQTAQWQALDFDEAAFLAKVGLTSPSGERGVSALERLWARPTADINGIWGGYAGIGAKTVIASRASAKISFRLVADQDPEAVYAAFQKFVQDRLPPGATMEMQHFGLSPGIEIATDNPWVGMAQAALADEYGRPAVLMGSGGSIPVVESLRRILGIDSVLMGFSLDDDQIHSPNEKFEQICFHHGIRAHARLISKFSEM